MSSVIGLELPNAWRTSQAQNGSFDISADQLNATANRQMFIPSGVVDWGAVLLKNVLDPVDDQDVATKIYVDTNGGNLWSTFPAQANVDYISTFKNINLIDPVDPQDSATKKYVDDNVGAQSLGGLTDVTLTNEQNNDVIQFNGLVWVNQPISVPAGSLIQQGNSSETVIDTGVGRVETVLDNILKFNIEQSLTTSANPIFMSGQAITSLQNPSSPQDAATKDYVDTEISNAGIKTDLNSLDDVTVVTPLVNQVLVNNGSGNFVNQLLTKSQLLTSIAYEDEVNTFTQNNIFLAGLQLAVDQNLNLADGFLSDAKYIEWSEQVTDPTGVSLDETRMFLDDGSDFGSVDPLLNVLIDRGGVIVKKPISTSETIFALKDFSNGMFIDETGSRLSDNNPNIRVQIFNESNEATGSYRAVLDGEIFTIPSPDVSVTPANTIDLTEGTDTAPVKHFVILELQLGVPTLVSNTVEFPTTGDFVLIGTFLLQSRVSIFADSAAGFPYAINAPDYEIFDDAFRGHLAHINDRLLSLDSLYRSGIALTTAPLVGGGTAGNVTFTSTAGKSVELHGEDIESYDITSTGAIALVENEGTQQPTEVTPVNDIGLGLIGLTCANGTTIIDGSPAQTINVVLYTIHNDNEPNTTNYGINVPVDAYVGGSRVDDAIADSSNFAVKNVPLNVRGVTLLIAEVVIDITNATTFEVVSVKDLRGQIPGASGGSGGGGSGGATQLNDLSDVTLNTPLVNESLVNDGAGQFVNKLVPQFETVNSWTNNQVYVPFAIGTGPSGTDGQFYTESIDGTNTGLFVNLQVAGVVTKLRLA